MSGARAVLFWCCLFTVATLQAQNFDAAVNQIAPSGVQLGTFVEDLKAARTNLFEGPVATWPGVQQSKTYPIFMENQGVGAPGHLSYWYLTAQDRVVGVLKTRSLVGISRESGEEDARQMFLRLSKQLGQARQETLIRKGVIGFVPVRSDVWNDPSSGGKVYFIATDKEITVAAVEASDFPLGQIFIRPNDERFPLENESERTVHDIARPTDVVGGSSESEPTPKAEVSLAAPAQTLPQPTASPKVAPSTVNKPLMSRSSDSFPIGLVVGAVLIIVGFTSIIFYRRREL